VIKNPVKERKQKETKVPRGDHHQVKLALKEEDINNIVVEVDDAIWKQTRVLK
jgi:hypothetical protein